MTYSLQSGTFDHYYKEALRQEFLKRIQRTAKHDYEDAEFHGFAIFIIDTYFYSRFYSRFFPN